MTPGQISGSIEEICEGLDRQRREKILLRGSDSESQPFTVEFNPREVTQEEASRILEAVRDRFPMWRIKGEWKQR